MTEQFDTAALADRIISERNLDAQSITHPRGRLEFSPSMVGDAAYICDAVRALTPADRESIATQGMRFNSGGLQIGFRALHINPEHSLPQSLMTQTAAAVMALEIATRLRVTIQ
jgi:hypothetical protein